MESHHRKRIKDNVESLIPLINLKSLMPFLISRRIFTKPMISDILSQSSDYNCKHSLLMELCRRGPQAFDSFVDCLVETRHIEAARLIQTNIDINAASLSHNSSNKSIDIIAANDNKIRVRRAVRWTRADDIYLMESKPRGYCLIFNNVEFERNTFDQRAGSDADAKRLDEVFQELGFTVFLKRNKKASEMKALCHSLVEMINTFVKENSKKMDAFVLIILSHGLENVVFGIDNSPVDIFSLIEIFNNEKCFGLRGSPKMFFIQACRGDKTDFGVNLNTEPLFKDYEIKSKSVTDTIPLKPQTKTCVTDSRSEGIEGIENAEIYSLPYKKVAAWQDIIIGYSTMFGYVSMRHPDMGSWYCQALATVLTQHACDERLFDILRLVENEIRKMQTHDGDKQSTSIKLIGWNKKLYFNPGLFISDNS